MTTKQNSHQPTSQKARYVKPTFALLGSMGETEAKASKPVAGTEKNTGPPGSRQSPS